MTVQLWDEAIPGGRTLAGSLTLNAGRVTVRELLETRVLQEVERYNRSLGETFQGLVQPEQSEQTLNGFRMTGDTAERVPLPFEGDRILAVILSKAFLLINDAQIRDESIRRQL